MRVNNVITAALLIIALSAASASAGEPGGTPDELFFTEAAVGTSAGIALFVGGYLAGGDAEENEGGTREKLSLAIYATAPLATALGTYVTGETRGMRSRNRGAAWFSTTGVCYGLTALAAGGTYAFTKSKKEEAAVSAALYAVIPSAFLAAVVYNAVKEPYFAEIPGYSGVTVTPAVSFVGAADGRDAAAVYGVTLSF